jgi:hypothetical protein
MMQVKAFPSPAGEPPNAERGTSGFVFFDTANRDTNRLAPLPHER